MMYYKDNKWHIADEKIVYARGDNEFNQKIGQEGKQWWIDFETKWDDMKIIEFIDIEITAEQEKRLEEVNQLGLKEGNHQILTNYVVENKFPEKVNHPLKELESKSRISNMEDESIMSMLATVEMYEKNLELENESINTMIAIIELYEMLGGQ